MKKHLITRFLVLLPLSLFIFQFHKKDTLPSPKKHQLSLSDTVKAKPNLQHTDKDDTLEKIAHYIANDYLSPADLKVIGMNERKFRFEPIDLNGDGRKEVFISFFTPYFCGTGGCTMILLDDNLKPITKFTVTRPPVYIDPATQNGWNILYLQDGDQWKELTYKNGKYPSNPSVLPNTSKKPIDKAIVIFKNTQSIDYKF
jgi:hypothetical protein